MKTAIEALFQAMISDYWFTASSGDVESPTGAFAYVTNEWREIPSILDAFESITSVYGEPLHSDIVGSFLVVEDSDGNVHITRYDSDALARSAYMRLEADFLAWDTQGDDTESDWPGKAEGYGACGVMGCTDCT